MHNRLRIVIGFLFVIYLSLSFSVESPTGYTGSNGTTCSSNANGCHGGGSFQGVINFDYDDFLPPNTTIPMEIELCYLTTGPTPVRAGFSMNAQDAGFGPVGTFVAGSNTAIRDGGDYVNQDGSINFAGDTCITYDFSYTTPPPFPDPSNYIIFSYAAVFGNGSGSSGDNTVSSFSQIIRLPVELAYFDVKITEENNVQLEWKTYSEINADVFIIQRSSDGSTFEDIGQVDATGFSTIEIEYSFLDDTKTLDGLMYYRLKQVDFDGSVEFSPIKAIDLSKNEIANTIHLFPNPTRANSTINIEGISDKHWNKLSYQLTDITGKNVQVGTSNEQSIGSLQIGTIPPGLYLLTFWENGQLLGQRKLIIK